MRLSLMLLTMSLSVPLGLPAGVTSPGLFQVQSSGIQKPKHANAHKAPHGGNPHVVRHKPIKHTTT